MRAWHGSTAWHDLVPRLLSEHGSREVAEIGVWQGELSERILRRCLGVHRLWLVDPWRPVYVTLPDERWAVCGPGTNSVEMERALSLVRQRIAPFVDRVTILRLPSVEAAREIADGSLDAVLIDALHFENAVMDDIRAWLPKLRPGGLMVGDDMSDYYPGVKMGVEKVFRDQYRAVGQTWWTTKEAACSMESVPR